MNKMLQLAVVCCAASTMIFADGITVYNGSNEAIAVTIVQGAKDKSGAFMVHPNTLQAGNLPKGQVYVEEIQPRSGSIVERPNRTLGKDTMLVVTLAKDRDNLIKSLMKGNALSADILHKIGQVGNKEIFIGPKYAQTSKATRALRDVALYKTYKDMLYPLRGQVVIESNPTKFPVAQGLQNEPITLKGSEEGTLYQKTKKQVSAASVKSKNALIKALKSAKKGVKGGYKSMKELATSFKRSLGGAASSLVVAVSEAGRKIRIFNKKENRAYEVDPNNDRVSEVENVQSIQDFIADVEGHGYYLQEEEEEPSPEEAVYA